MEELAWFATTAEGERLGQLAAAGVQVESVASPWWYFPLEPLHWFWTLSSAAPHSFYTAALYCGVALLAALWAARQGGLRAGLAWLVTLIMLFVGGLFAEGWADTVIPHGIRWRVPPGASFQLGNLHSHSQASGGSLMPEDLVRWHLDHGFTVVGITDSNKLYPGQRALHYAQENHLPAVVVPGEEYRGATHLLLLNLHETIRPDRLDVPQAIRAARAQGGVVLAAHSWTGKYTDQQLADWGVHGFEVCSGRATAEASTLDLCHRGRLAAVGNLDYRQGNTPFTATVFPTWANSPEKVQGALLSGQCATLYVPAWAEKADFSVVHNLRHRLQNLSRDGGRLLLPGLLFWMVAGWLAGRHLKPRPGRYLLAIVTLAACTGTLGLWSVWWRFKTGWFPRLELALLLWLVACPACAFMAWGETLKGRPDRLG